MHHTSLIKTCATCGQDVRSLPRIKDSSGRYFCEPCWETVPRNNPELFVPSMEPPPALDESDDNLIPFAESTSKPRALPQRSAAAADRSLSVANGRLNQRAMPPVDRASDPGLIDQELPEHLSAIARWERRLLVVFLVSIFPLFAIMLIPVHFFVVYKLARAMGKNGLLWATGTFVPFAGLAVLLVLNVQATQVLKSAGLYAPMFRSWRRRV